MAAMAPDTVRHRVPELLEKRQMSASDLMRAAGISWPTAQALAAGKDMNLQLDTLEKVAKALGVGVLDLLVEEKGKKGG